jgi:hypothetical protein
MFELLSVIGVMLVAASFIERQRSEKSSKEARERNRAAEAARPVATAKTAMRVEASATAPATGSQAVNRDARFGFVASFGVRPDQLRELHVYAVSGMVGEFPRKVADLLWKLYDNGFAVGEEIMAVLHHGRPLKEGEAIYVAVARDEKANTTRTVAFLDRARAC